MKALLTTLALATLATACTTTGQVESLACNRPADPPAAGVLWGGPSQGFDNRTAWRMICEDVKQSSND